MLTGLGPSFLEFRVERSGFFGLDGLGLRVFWGSGFEV